MLYWASLRPSSVLDAFNPNLPTIVELSNQFGEPGINAIMVKWMNSFIRFYSTSGSMDAIQVADTINLIRDEYPHYTQEDFKLFFNLARKGYFGQVYGRIDGEVIMNWLKKYDIHRDTVAQSESIKEADYFKPLHQIRDTEGVSYSEFLEIQSRAENGDKEAIKMLTPPKCKS